MHAQSMYAFSICVIGFLLHTLLVTNDISWIGYYVLCYTGYTTHTLIKNTPSNLPSLNCLQLSA